MRTPEIPSLHLCDTRLRKIEALKRHRHTLRWWNNLNWFNLLKGQTVEIFALRPEVIDNLLLLHLKNTTYSFIFFPGVLVKSLIEQLVVNQLLDYGAHLVQSPNFYDMEHPALKSYMDRFPARQYKVLSDDKPYFLRFSACFGQFLFLSQSVISHKALPVKCLEVSGATFFNNCTNQISDRTSLSTWTIRRSRGITEAKRIFNAGHAFPLCQYGHGKSLFQRTIRTFTQDDASPWPQLWGTAFVVIHI